ncbi:response regulator transcription factor [Catelliglobosispora koreensis]|uniref:response regulator transcription factor n=1 Tax=Catelliglobosispora koreensis TaxID=129052 RepID=UPI000363C3A8|nr:response regulator transcription factor [Catelliglobosispora koreensis]
MTKIRVLIADDHEMVRRGLSTFLSLHADMEVIGEVSTGAAAISLASEQKPDVVLLDLKMPGEDPVHTVRELNGTKVLIVTSFTEVSQLLPVVREGVAGVVFKNIDPSALANAIRTVHSGHVLLPPSLAAAMTEPFTNRLGSLTARERDVLAEIARGRSNREIARILVLAEKTVKTHVSSILMKLSVEDRTQAALYAVRHGLVTD